MRKETAPSKIIDGDAKKKWILEEAIKELKSKYNTNDKVPEIIELRKKSYKSKKGCGCK